MSTEYQKVITALKRRKKGAVAADVCAATALSLAVVHELLPKAADEYSGHLRVTESGEILYYFPNGFTSRYRGLSAALKKTAKKVFLFLKTASAFLFKIWIVVMLVGYFIFFIALALASVFLSVAGKSGGRGGKRGGGSVNFGIFNLIWRIWFYSELTRPRYGYGYERRNVKQKSETRPLHKAVFSFVFGEEDPNKNWEDQEYKAIISYIQANRGVISLAEYMAFTGKNSQEAQTDILSFCSKFEGSPEATEEGTIVYRFDKLLLNADKEKLDELIPPVKRLKIFSDNKKSTNGWFAVINAVNIIFGSYFLYQSFNAGQLLSDIQYQSASKLYAYTHYFFSFMANEPHNLIKVALGLIPLVFSILFWIIPTARFFIEKKENNEIKLKNFKRFSFSKIFSSPNNIDISAFNPSVSECRPDDLASAADRVIKDMGAISNPQIEIKDNKTIYTFNELEREKNALEKYRQSVDISRQKLGDTVFDTGN
ncbi:hypothetical protein R84B8_00653 [Treponema sp. R8-4-B8]